MDKQPKFWQFTIGNVITLITLCFSVALFASKVENAGTQNGLSIINLDKRVTKLEEAYQKISPEISEIKTDLRWVKEYLQKNPSVPK